ncbi:hypothetical protein [uncultured Roseobacter sp.]|uniref:hypothetical protein n=1 Tax=uncultured Roseobacter sp. TaxID=114847 RepID=UPI002638B8C0|nr:hypothetical protein [uncultured Roseobacter sp.]
MKKTTSLAIIATWLLSAGVGLTATLGLDTKPAPVVTVSGTFTSVPGAFSFFNGAGGVSTDPAAGSGLIASLSGIIGTDRTADTFALNIGPGISPVPFLSGLSSDFGYVFSDTGPDTLEFLIGSVGGTEAGSFGNSLLATLEGEFGTADTFFAFGTGFQPVSATLTVAPVASVAPIPLPATGGVLFAATLSFVALRRRRQKIAS